MTTHASDVGAGVDDRLIEKLQQILTLAEKGATEGEKAAAAAMLAKFLAKHNLSMADLEAKGSKAPPVREQAHDLGKAAFQWKLDLAEAIAQHYFCYGMVNRREKTVQFIGRPDNVEALQMLYEWLINQIKAISANARREWQVEMDEHVDPLRWQVNFGIGCVERLGEMLREAKRKQQAEVDTTALVLHHDAEISDYMEQKYGWRVDGQPTASERAYREEREARRQTMEDLLRDDPEEFYRQYPQLHPDAIARRNERIEKENAEWLKKEERNAGRRIGRRGPRIDYVKDGQAADARYAGRSAAGKVNLSPFLGGAGDGRKKGNLR